MLCEETRPSQFEWEKQSTDVNVKMNKMLKLSDKDFQSVMVNYASVLNDKLSWNKWQDKISQQKRKREKELIKKNQMGIEIKNIIILKENLHWMGTTVKWR